MKKLMVVLMAVALCLGLTGVAIAEAPEGTVGTINTITNTPVTSLDLDSDGSLTTVATILVSNNYENAWELTLDFTNAGVTTAGKFIRSSAAGDASSVASEIDITALQLVPNASPGTLGTDLTAPTGTFTLVSGEGTFDPGATQSTATVAYLMDVKCSWVASNANLQGTYTETITATLAIGDGS